METLTSLSQFEQDIRAALKAWHEAGSDISPLDHLQLFQRALASGANNARQAINEIIYDALEALAVDHQVESDLLRRRFLDGLVMHGVANQLNLSMSTAYRKQEAAIKQLALILRDRELRARHDYQANLEKRLNLPPEGHLFGFEDHLSNLRKVLVSPQTSWLHSIEGLGGLGKTALAAALIRQPELTSRFYDVLWISAKQEMFLPGIELEQKTAPALTGETLIDMLVEQLDSAISPAKSLPEKQILLTKLLKQNPYLIVIDNLETVIDYQILLPLLRELSNPSKFLLTSRYSLQAYPDVYCRGLTDLTPEATSCFIRHEASIRGLSLLANASEKELKNIYEVVGGNPLALKLVIGQTSVLPLSQTLNNLKDARGKSIDKLYMFIYWQTWEMLDLASQQVFLVMPLAKGGTLTQLMALTQLDIDQISDTLQKLVRLSLVQVGGDLEDRRYTIHRLTETFLLKEAIKWNDSA